MEEKPYICIDFLSKNVKKMKKIIMMTLMLVCGMTAVMAQKPAQIKFDKTTHNFGSFSEKHHADARCLNIPRLLFNQVRRGKSRLPTMEQESSPGTSRNLSPSGLTELSK